MGTEDVFDTLPFIDLLGIEITKARDGYAEGKVELTEELSSSPSRKIAHGGVHFALADTVGGAAIASLVFAPTPTIDMRIDYLNPATKDLYAEGEVLRNGNTTAVVDISVYDEDELDIAEARGIYKTGGFDEESANIWKG